MSNTVKRLSQCDFWVLGVDDMIYRLDSGLHAAINHNIASGFNHLSKKDPQRKHIQALFVANLARGGQSVANPLHIQPSEMGAALPAIVQTVSELLPHHVPEYLGRLYGNRYDLIKPDPYMVEAFNMARAKDIGIYLYTNSPSLKQPGQDGHVQHVLRAVGMTEETIDYLRARTYDVFDAAKAGAGKPTRQSMRDFIRFASLKPSRAFMAGAIPRNLEPGVDAGMQALWTYTSTQAPASRDNLIAKTMDAAITHNSGNTLYKIALAR